MPDNVHELVASARPAVHRSVTIPPLALLFGTLAGCATAVGPIEVPGVAEAMAADVTKCRFIKTVTATSPFYGMFAAAALRSTEREVLLESKKLGASHVVFLPAETVYGSTTQHARAYLCP